MRHRDRGVGRVGWGGGLRKRMAGCCRYGSWGGREPEYEDSSCWSAETVSSESISDGDRTYHQSSWPGVDLQHAMTLITRQ